MATQVEMPMGANSPHTSHPSIPELMVLVSSAIFEVICVSLPGYIIARWGSLDRDKQKFLSALNINVFTPCLSKSSIVLSREGGEGIRESGPWRGPYHAKEDRNKSDANLPQSSPRSRPN